MFVFFVYLHDGGDGLDSHFCSDWKVVTSKTYVNYSVS